ncbi:Com family DNA-binding transcriptional regulator [Xanthomonas campestris]|uniref:Com family DNA-binding transcriptional regulator n=1 Tax=Xanthomonas campestris TaxID=339 RepID=UPI000E32CFD0|nr:Com family DNA-binding transcriptional regulator [Xanthomonas campestris]MEA9576924.1 Com family DNA-binding transcriptional regulator [Xanthomonas campestris]RFF69748.1 Com family DNA-binding transcriptional regulator [Xanthomonas campestris pv. campestris]
MLKNLRCGECARLLCKAGAFDEIQIKCPRCGTLNHLKAESLTSDRRERIQEGSHHEKPAAPGRRPDHPAHVRSEFIRRADH